MCAGASERRVAAGGRRGAAEHNPQYMGDTPMTPARAVTRAQDEQHARCVHGLTSFLGQEEVRPRGGGARNRRHLHHVGRGRLGQGPFLASIAAVPRRMPDERGGRLPCGRPRGLQLAGVGLPAPSQGVKQDGPRRTGTGPWAGLLCLPQVAPRGPRHRPRARQGRRRRAGQWIWRCTETLLR